MENTKNTDKHKLDVMDLSKWADSAKLLYASSTNPNKKLYATVRGNFEVYHNKVLVLECIQPYTAIEKYNSIK